MKIVLYYYLSRVLAVILLLFRLFPVKEDRVILTAFNGRRYACNPKYIAIALLETGRYEVIYALKDEIEVSLPRGMHRVKYRSIRYYYYLMTSKFIIFNSSGVAGLLKYREQQIVINTWHASSCVFKMVGTDIFKNKYSIKMRKIFGENTNGFISCVASSEYPIAKAMCLSPDRVLTIGYPRNDIFFRNDISIKIKVQKYFSIPTDIGIILYAPTYRDEKQSEKIGDICPLIDATMVIDSAERVFGQKFVFIFRAHHDMCPDSIGTNCLNGSAYPDMQELLYAADIFITNESSCMWDFALQRKPGFLYSPDFHEVEVEHPFYTNYTTWPYPMAFSNDELKTCIESFDETVNRNRINSFFNSIGCCDDGKASERFIEYMERIK